MKKEKGKAESLSDLGFLKRAFCFNSLEKKQKEEHSSRASRETKIGNKKRRVGWPWGGAERAPPFSNPLIVKICSKTYGNCFFGSL